MILVEACEFVPFAIIHRNELHWALRRPPNVQNDTWGKSLRWTWEFRRWPETMFGAKVDGQRANKISSTTSRIFLAVFFFCIYCHRDQNHQSGLLLAAVSTRYSKSNADFRDEKLFQGRWFGDAQTNCRRQRTRLMRDFPVIALSMMALGGILSLPGTSACSIHFDPSWLETAKCAKSQRQARLNFEVEICKCCKTGSCDLMAPC